MAMQIRIFGDKGLGIPDLTFTEGIDFEIGSMLQEGEQAFREEMVAIIPAGNNSTVFRQYAQRIGSQEVFLALDTDQTGTFTRPRPDVPMQVDRDRLTDTELEASVEESSGAVGYEFVTKTDVEPPGDGDSGTRVVPDPPAMPANLSADGITASRFTLSWDADTNVAATYEVYVSTTQGEPDANDRLVPLSSPRYHAAGRRASTLYYYYVRTCLQVSPEDTEYSAWASGSVTTLARS